MVSLALPGPTPFRIPSPPCPTLHPAPQAPTDPYGRGRDPLQPHQVGCRTPTSGKAPAAPCLGLTHLFPQPPSMEKGPHWPLRTLGREHRPANMTSSPPCPTATALHWGAGLRAPHSNHHPSLHCSFSPTSPMTPHHHHGTTSPHSPVGALWARGAALGQLLQAPACRGQ